MSNADKMERLLVFNLPISTWDLMAIEGILREKQLFCTSFGEEDPYSLGLYYGQAEIHDVRACMLLDRNVFARIVALARGARAAPDHQVAAAVMAFAQCADMEIEPALAVIEGVETRAGIHAAKDLALFSAVNDVHPSEFADVALGRASSLRTAPRPVEGATNWSSPTHTIREYSFVYPLVLQIGLIELDGGPMHERMRRFLDWTYDNWYFSAVATTFAAMCFSGAAPRGALKRLRDSDRSRALKGLRNCAWDLTYVTFWVGLLKRQNQENRLYVFCSLDKTLLRVAQLMLVEPRSSDTAVAEALRQILGASNYDHYVRLMEGKDDPARPTNRTAHDGTDARPRLVADLLEQRVLEAV